MEFKETREEYSMEIKYATTEDITAIAAVEAECFPPAEAATEKELADSFGRTCRSQRSQHERIYGGYW